MIITVDSGGLDPINSDHVKYLNSAKNLGDKLIVLLNSDQWVQNKKDKFYNLFEDDRLKLKELIVNSNSGIK